MQLKDADADDVLYPLGVLFQVRRASRMVSSELAVDLGIEDLIAGSSQWPVTVIELSACLRFFETVELLETQGAGVGKCGLQALLERRLAASSSEELPEILRRCGEALEISNDPGHAELAMKYFDESVRKLTAEGGDMRTLAKSLLGLARGFATHPPAGDKGKQLVGILGEKAIEALEQALGADHPETKQAKTAWQEIKQKVSEAATNSST